MANIHANACGPIAIERALEHYDYTDKTSADISKDILKHGGLLNLVRTLASLFNDDANSITFPEEMVSALKRHGFEVEVTQSTHKDLEKIIKDAIDDNKVGIVLIRKKTSDFDYHYQFFQTLEEAKSIYGDAAIYIQIYILNR